MILSDVLHILQKPVDSIGIKNTPLYVMLFTDDTNENLVLYNDAAKKVFSNRGLTDKVSMEYCNEYGFLHLTDNIMKKYLPLIRQHTSIYNQLKELVENSKQLPDSYKEQLISSCMPENDYQLARFIAACILCGSYHSNRLNAKEKDTEYHFGIDFMNLNRRIITTPIVRKIWKASQQEFLVSHKEGNRFHDLNIIQRLLPKGYITKSDFHMRAKTTDGKIRSLMDICKEENKDISVIGEGGIGKTTFLQQLLEEEFWDKEKKPTVYASGRPIPIFIELRRCPSQIDHWYEDNYKKTNFITRYIGQMLENHSSLNAVSEETLISVEKEMQRVPENGIPQYMLLLDGFNEVSIAEKGTSQSCRALLSNEISVIHQEYANVRIIATSRKTQSAYFTSTFQNVYLIGLEEDDIRDYLSKCMFSNASIGITLANKTLVKCLRIPLFLCMFSYAKPADDMMLPETPGEILYSFFHRNSFFYNIRKHAEDTHTNPLNELETALVLDFILPYIGWVMEQNDIFSLSESQLTQTIQDALDIIKNLLITASSLPYEDFSYSKDILNQIYLSLPDYFLQPEDHVDSIDEYAYSGQYCYTLDDTGTIKCWDIFSGCLEYILQSGAPNGQYDYSPDGLMKISSDGKWLAAKVYHNEANDCSACLYVFNLEKPDQNPVTLYPQKQHRKITSFSFTEDNNSILYLADQHDLYCFDIITQKEIYSCHYEQFLKQTELYASTAYSDIYAFSGEYDLFDCTDYYPEYEDDEPLPEENDHTLYIEDIDSDTDWEENSIPTPCVLLRCIPSSKEIEELYRFSGEPGTYPLAKYFPSLDCFLLFNEESRQLEKFYCSRKEAEIVWEELTIENGNASPSSIQYCPGHPKECYIIYPQCSYNVDLVTHKQNGILMKYDVSALSKLINNDSEMEELIFYPNVIPNCNRFIIRNSENTYEWDTANDILRLRYNTALFECRDMFFDKIHGLGILVHQFNGISVFSGSIPKLVNAYCYPNAEYYASGCCYHEVTQNLAIMFSKASHEYVEIINLHTSKREIVFSTLLAHETLESIQFHPDGRYLLITLEDRCVEYQLSSKKTYLVEKAGDNELFIDGSYTDEERPMIRIAIVEHFNYDNLRIEPHCDHYAVNHTSKAAVYKKEWRYYMPILTHETAANFLHYSYDIGNGCSYTKEEYQTYWCTCGFFLHNYPDDEAFQHIRCSKFIGNREQKINKSFGRLQMIFCRHDFALATQYRTERNCNNYSYCSDDFSQVIEIFDHHNITYWKDLSAHPTSERYVYNNGENTSEEMAYSYWDTVIPWFSDTLLACYEQYHLLLLKRALHGKSIEILYTPGIAINGCSFYGVKANDKLKELPV